MPYRRRPAPGPDLIAAELAFLQTKLGALAAIADAVGQAWGACEEQLGPLDDRIVDLVEELERPPTFLLPPARALTV